MQPSGIPTGGDARRPTGSLLIAPLLSSVGVAVSAASPLFAFALLPWTAARLSRTLFLAGKEAVVLALAVLTVLLSTLFLYLVFGTAAFLVAPPLAIAATVLPALALLVGARHALRRDRLHLLVSAVTAVGVLSIVLGATLAAGRDPGGVVASWLDGIRPELVSYHRNLGFTGSALESVGTVLDGMRWAFSEHLLGLCLAGSVLYAAIVVYPFGALATLDTKELAAYPFSEFQTPTAVAVLFVPAGVLAALVRDRLAIDVLMVLLVLFFFRGLAILAAFLSWIKAGVFFRAVLYVFVFQVPVPIVVALGGLFDEFFDFRSRMDNSKKPIAPGESRDV